MEPFFLIIVVTVLGNNTLYERGVQNESLVDNSMDRAELQTWAWGLLSIIQDNRFFTNKNFISASLIVILVFKD